IATFAILGVASVDSFAWEGKGGNLILDSIARFSPKYRERIVHHEAGHFLVASLLGVSITGYTLSAWEALQQNQPGQGGVSFNDEELAQQVGTGHISAQMLDRYCTVLMAGIAAEKLIYDEVEGGADDKSKLNGILNSLGFSPNSNNQKSRFYTLQAKTLIQENWSKYQNLVDAMHQRKSVSECLKASK
ncbi:MAG: ATP-dependent Zn protease, partial [Mastigocoleus sp. MO_167.B18]|nr:ATP-dependent Zn protease [Mastigocoleus sp. MO_167.B18]